MIRRAALGKVAVYHYASQIPAQPVAISKLALELLSLLKKRRGKFRVSTTVVLPSCCALLGTDYPQNTRSGLPLYPSREQQYED